MKNKSLLFVLGFGLLLYSCKKDSGDAGKTESVVLKNDTYTGGGTVAFQAGMVSGEAGAVVLGPVGKKFQIKKVLFLFGGTTSQSATITLRVYKDVGVADPGSPVHDADYTVNTSNDNFCSLDVSGSNLHFEASDNIRIAIFVKNNGLPGLAVDQDGTNTSGRNWLFTASAWSQSSVFGIIGDWIIRVEVDKEI